MIGIPNAQMPDEGVLTGGQPTEDQFLEAKAEGYKTIINLRGVGEPGTDTQPALMVREGLAYVHIPVSGPHDISIQKAKELATALDGAAQPVMVHCASGNRVGALFALKAYFVDGASADDAITMGRQSGLTRLEPFVRDLIQRG